jgi:histidine kinase
MNPALGVALVLLAGLAAVVTYLLIKLNRQRYEYRNLFESVPCTITVQDRNFRLMRFNREFSENFDPAPGDFCYHAYKGRSEKCEICPVEETFRDGKPHLSEETRLNRDGTRKYWLVRTSPVKNAKGEIVAAMEMCLDVTHRKMLEVELERSEKKYYAIFDNIPNPVFVLDAETFEILDVNKSVDEVYGRTKDEMAGRNFLELFTDAERDHYAFKLRTSAELYRVRHTAKNGRIIFTNLRLSPSEYWGYQVLLVTVSDITKRLETEQQLTQASKLATLGEMATGIAHELNQPLTVIKMASGFFMKKLSQGEAIPETVLVNMSEKINNNVDRANRIINHMRDFARKSAPNLERVDVNEVLERAHDIFSQQLKLRQIEVVWALQDDLPPIQADAGRLEQVFINLLVNARDAIDDRWEDQAEADGRRIVLKTALRGRRVIVEVSDSGSGVPEGIAEKIFEPFFTTKEVGKGTGLGLSISYGIVKDFKGDIRVTAGDGGGACFHLEFPAREEAAAPEGGDP